MLLLIHKPAVEVLEAVVERQIESMNHAVRKIRGQIYDQKEVWQWLCLENESLENVDVFYGTCIWLEMPLYATE